jgi:hypothetical protein
MSNRRKAAFAAWTLACEFHPDREAEISHIRDVGRKNWAAADVANAFLKALPDTPEHVGR